MTRQYSTRQSLQNIAITALMAFVALLAIVGLIVLTLTPESL
jgi:hypothetical protein